MNLSEELSRQLGNAHLLGVKELGVCIEEPLRRESSSAVFLLAVEST